MHSVSDEFTHDVFLSRSAKDAAVSPPLVEPLRVDGLSGWFDEWEIKPGDSNPAEIEEGLDQPRTLALCMSVNAFGSACPELKVDVLQFRDPLKERGLVQLRLDE